MDENQIIKSMNEIFCSVFDNDDIQLSPETSAKDIEEWDSLGHIGLILAVEKKFGIRFTTAEIANTKRPGENVGTFCRLIKAKIVR